MTVDAHVDIAARDLAWDGCYNVRDLGGLPTAHGAETVRGRIVRADNLDLLTRDGWQALWDLGVRTVIDLRNEEECRPAVTRPAGLKTVRIAFDAYASPEWIRRWHPPGLPNNLGQYLADYPQALIDFGNAVAAAADGGIVVHCAGGRDRTGLAAMMLLVHAGVDQRIAAADWEHSIARLARRYAGQGAAGIEADDLAAPGPRQLAVIRRQVAHFLAHVDTAAFFGDEVRSRLLP